jgi:hypothetical protein
MGEVGDPVRPQHKLRASSRHLELLLVTLQGDGTGRDRTHDVRQQAARRYNNAVLDPSDLDLCLDRQILVCACHPQPVASKVEAYAWESPRSAGTTRTRTASGDEGFEKVVTLASQLHSLPTPLLGKLKRNLVVVLGPVDCG